MSIEHAPPAAPLDRLQKGVRVFTRYLTMASSPGSQSTVVRVRAEWVLCDFGANLSGQRLRKWMPAEALALV